MHAICIFTMQQRQQQCSFSQASRNVVQATPKVNIIMPLIMIIIFLVLTCLSLCNTQARAVNLIHAVLCDDEGVTQVRGC